MLVESVKFHASCLTDRALSCVAHAADCRRGAQVQCQKATEIDRNALCHGSCSALLGGEPRTLG
jgi:hypothetical protein